MLLIIFTSFFTILPNNVFAQSDELLFETNSQTAKIGDTLEVSVLLNLQSTESNTITLDIEYDITTLEVQDLDTNNSVYDSSVEENYSGGHIHVTRFMSPGTSFQGKGEILKVRFKVLKSSQTDISFGDETLVLDTSTNKIEVTEKVLTLNSEVRDNKASDVVNQTDKPNLFVIVLSAIFISVIVAALYFLFVRKRNHLQNRVNS